MGTRNSVRDSRKHYQERQIDERTWEFSLGHLLQRTTNPLWRQESQRIRRLIWRRTVYVVRDGETVLYVGSTRYTPIERLTVHLNSNDSALGQRIKQDQIAARDWMVTVIKFDSIEDMLATEARLTAELHPILRKEYTG